MVVIHNATDLVLTLRDYHRCETAALQGSYGSKKLKLPAQSKKKVPRASTLLKKFSYQKEIHIMSSGGHVLLVLRSDHFKKNEGKDISLSFGWDFLLAGFKESNGACPPSHWICGDVRHVRADLDKEMDKYVEREARKKISRCLFLP